MSGQPWLWIAVAAAAVALLAVVVLVRRGRRAPAPATPVAEPVPAAEPELIAGEDPSFVLSPAVRRDDEGRRRGFERGDEDRDGDLRDDLRDDDLRDDDRDDDRDEYDDEYDDGGDGGVRRDGDDHRGGAGSGWREYGEYDQDGEVDRDVHEFQEIHEVRDRALDTDATPPDGLRLRLVDDDVDTPAGGVAARTGALTRPDSTRPAEAARAALDTGVLGTGGFEAVLPEDAPRLGPHPGSVLPNPDGSVPTEGYPVKANAGSRRYHLPESPYYDRTRADLWFRSPEEAEAAGFTAWDDRPAGG
ncbi:MAG TPA: hypothetical protein VD813_10905 [Pseudonocardia sp.]|nr:hypothetical protein [Pseudonocardia sp.]